MVKNFFFLFLSLSLSLPVHRDDDGEKKFRDESFGFLVGVNVIKIIKGNFLVARIVTRTNYYVNEGSLHGER